MTVMDWCLALYGPIPRNRREFRNCKGQLGKFLCYTLIRSFFVVVMVLNYLYTFDIQFFNYMSAYQAIFLGYYFFLISMGFYPIDMLLGVVDQIPQWIRLSHNNDSSIKTLGGFDSLFAIMCLAALWVYSHNYHKAHDIHHELHRQNHQYQNHHHQHEYRRENGDYQNEEHHQQDHHQHDNTNQCKFFCFNFECEDDGEHGNKFQIKEKGFLAIVAVSYFILYMIKYWGVSVHSDNLQIIITETYYDIIICVYIVYSIKDVIGDVKYVTYFWLNGLCIWVVAFVITLVSRLTQQDEADHKNVNASSKDTYHYMLLLIYYFINNILTGLYLLLGAYSFYVYNEENGGGNEHDEEKEGNGEAETFPPLLTAGEGARRYDTEAKYNIPI